MNIIHFNLMKYYLKFYLILGFSVLLLSCPNANNNKTINLDGVKETKTVTLSEVELWELKCVPTFTDESGGNLYDNLAYNIEVKYGDIFSYDVTMDTALMQICYIDENNISIDDDTYISDPATIDVIITLPVKNTISMKLNSKHTKKLLFSGESLPPNLELIISPGSNDCNITFPNIVNINNLKIWLHSGIVDLQQIHSTGEVELDTNSTNPYDSFPNLNRITCKKLITLGQIIDKLHGLEVTEKVKIENAYSKVPLGFTFPDDVEIIIGRNGVNLTEELPVVNNLSLTFYKIYDENHTGYTIDKLQANDNIYIDLREPKITFDTITSKNITIHTLGTTTQINNLIAKNNIDFRLGSDEKFEVSTLSAGNNVTIDNYTTYGGYYHFKKIKASNLKIDLQTVLDFQAKGQTDELSLRGVDDSFFNLKELISTTSTIELYKSTATINSSDSISYTITDNSTLTYNESCLSVEELLNEDSTVSKY